VASISFLKEVQGRDAARRSPACTGRTDRQFMPTRQRERGCGHEGIMRRKLACNLFDKSEVKKLADELKWLARILGRARDAEVMRERLRQYLGDLPEEHSSDALPGPIEHELGAAYDTGYKSPINVRECLTGKVERSLDRLYSAQSYGIQTS
jgi:hypothetical protein